ncbi:DUF4198 domain-containing protein [Thiococcus pfennigii]|uniref:DUF4198 domain-containing protein n=1 Tax=Thiococcus pfennigii TaxID=1057 RepID=UPI001F5BE126|nr:DUF4198 domain-containing protein [Thiococcus pfennigii]
MKHAVLSACCAATLLAVPAVQAHFQLLYTPEVMLERPTNLDLELVFAHPMENGHTMDMGEPEAFFVVFKGEKTDLKDKLEPITWRGAHNEAKAYQTGYRVTRNGDYIFALVPAPYYEANEDIYIQQITKAYVNKGAMPTGWNEPLGLPTEIVPLTKPYQVFAGGTFTGQLLSDGKPAPGVECEIEFINTRIDQEGNAFGAEPLAETPATTIVAITDPNGIFTFGVPMPGVWGFACLGSGPATEHAGKELSQDAVLWINAQALNGGPTVGEAAQGASYRVRDNDSLSTISARVYGDAGAWQRIYEANRGQLSNPDALMAGMELVIP